MVMQNKFQLSADIMQGNNYVSLDGEQMTTTNKHLHKLLSTALALIDIDTDNADKHQTIADSLAHYGRRRWGPRFGDSNHKPTDTTYEVMNDNEH